MLQGSKPIEKTRVGAVHRQPSCSKLPSFTLNQAKSKTDPMTLWIFVKEYARTIPCILFRTNFQTLHPWSLMNLYRASFTSFTHLRFEYNNLQVVSDSKKTKITINQSPNNQQ